MPDSCLRNSGTILLKLHLHQAVLSRKRCPVDEEKEGASRIRYIVNLEGGDVCMKSTRVPAIIYSLSQWAPIPLVGDCSNLGTLPGNLLRIHHKPHKPYHPSHHPHQMQAFLFAQPHKNSASNLNLKRDIDHLNISLDSPPITSATTFQIIAKKLYQRQCNPM
ncbi:hypothetical protein EYC80_003148 [Monilinia laxa]|uniref:Uncharacterized protein n=1 Tax=Monilinia laxa TaxID=61186 RepID=A0A5N6KE39_MONLA|nr:hypothetical protein EYC80_003148 [Monilinia laxa]